MFCSSRPLTLAALVAVERAFCRVPLPTAAAAVPTTRAVVGRLHTPRGSAVAAMAKGGRARRGSKAAEPIAPGGAAPSKEGPPSTAASGAAAAAASTGSGSGRVLLRDLGQLVIGTVTRRPSASVKTPYVADVVVEGTGEQVLAHTPALDCAGLIVPGARVRMTANAPRKEGAPATRTTHSIQIAEEPREDGSVAPVGAHPSLAEAFAEAALTQHLVPDLGPYSRVLRQQTFGATRVDFVLEREGGELVLVEVKNVVCADYPEDGVPPTRSRSGVYTAPSAGYKRTAIFPHGAHKKPIGVVSDRAIKHVHELTLMQQAGVVDVPPTLAAKLSGKGGSSSKGSKASTPAAGGSRPVQAAVLFIVNRADCAAFRPCHEACGMFARVLRRAEEAGVQVLAYAVDWEGGKAYWGRRMPVVYGEAVSAADVDEDHLQRVLEFNATDIRTHWKSASAQKAAGEKVSAQKLEDAADQRGKGRGSAVAKAGKGSSGAEAAAGGEEAAADPVSSGGSRRRKAASTVAAEGEGAAAAGGKGSGKSRSRASAAAKRLAAVVEDGTAADAAEPPVSSGRRTRARRSG